jgi:hypothetical protein
MKLAQKLLAVMLPVFVLLLLITSRAQVAADSGQPSGFARSQPAGGVLFADSLSFTTTTPNVLGGGTWLGLPNMTQSVKQVNGGGYHQGVVYIPGGIINSTGPVLHNKMSYYTVATNRWRVDAQAMPMAIADAAICNDNAGKVHVINGIDGSAMWSSHQVYDTAHPIGARWTTAAIPEVAGEFYFSQGSGCVVIDHVLYLFGGYGNIGQDAPGALATTWAYDKNTDTWSDTGFTMNEARYWMGYGQKTNHGYVAGGTDDAGATAMDSTERFDPNSGWTTGTDLPVALLAPGLVGTESGVLVFGGGAPSGGLADEGVAGGGGYVLQNTTYLCTGQCPSNAGWSNVNRNLITARWFFGWAGGPPDGPFAAGGINTISGLGSIKSSERFQNPQQ